MAFGFDGGGASSAMSEVVENYYEGLSDVSSSSYPVPKGVNVGTAEDDEEEEDEELELGLCLGTKKRVTTGGSEGGIKGRAGSGEHCRILTAKDLPSMGSRASPLSSSSSSASSSSSPTMNSRGGAGAKRVTDTSGGGAHGVAGSGNPPRSQMVVGWPPIGAYRMNSMYNQSKDISSSNDTSNKKIASNIKMHKSEDSICFKDVEDKGRLARNSLFVKVNMDGDPIGRKVDLSAHVSYESLLLSLETMFCIPTSAPGSSINGLRMPKLLDGSSGFALTYKDKDGDWMLVGDVPWGMFLNTVERLRIMRMSETNELVS